MLVGGKGGGGFMSRDKAAEPIISSLYSSKECKISLPILLFFFKHSFCSLWVGGQQLSSLISLSKIPQFLANTPHSSWRLFILG
jgi:hypothetical protein